jgi:hypothetical protein
MSEELDLLKSALQRLDDSLSALDGLSAPTAMCSSCKKARKEKDDKEFIKIVQTLDRNRLFDQIGQIEDKILDFQGKHVEVLATGGKEEVVQFYSKSVEKLEGQLSELKREYREMTETTKSMNGCG